MRPAIEDPKRLRERRADPGSAGRACRDLETFVRACDAYEESPRSRAVVYLAMRGRTARRAVRGMPWRLFGGAGAVLACCALLAVLAARWLGHGPLAGSDPLAPLIIQAGQPTPEVASSSAGPRDQVPRPGAGAWTRIDVGEVGTIEASPTAIVDVGALEAGYQVRIRFGVLRAQIVRQDPYQPLVVTTPHLRVVVIGTRFDVHADAARSLVEVIEGAVQVESSAASVLVRAGESINSEDPRLASPASPAAPEPAAEDPAPKHRRPVRTALSIAACEMAASPELQRRCLERVATGDDLAAETALLRLASPATANPAEAQAAVERLRGYSRRFPEGVFAAEAALRELELLAALGRTEEVAAAGEAFQRRFSSDPRAAEVALARASALCRLPGRRAEVSRALRDLGDDVSPEVLKAARALRNRCAAETRRAADGPPSAPGTSPPAD